VFENFGVDQVWSQLLHFTEPVNRRVLGRLEQVATNDDFVEGLNEAIETLEKAEVPNDAAQEEFGDEEEKEEFGDYGSDNEGEDDFDYGDDKPQKKQKKAADDGYVSEDGMDDDEDLDSKMEDLEEEDADLAQLKMPEDLEGEGDEKFNMLDEDEDDEGPGIFGNDDGGDFGEEGEDEFEEEAAPAGMPE